MRFFANDGLNYVATMIVLVVFAYLVAGWLGLKDRTAKVIVAGLATVVALIVLRLTGTPGF